MWGHSLQLAKPTSGQHPRRMPRPSSCYLPIALQQRGGPEGHSHLCWSFGWLDLIEVTTAALSSECNGHALSRRYDLTVLLSTFQLLHYFSICNVLWALTVIILSTWTSCETLINHYPLQIKLFWLKLSDILIFFLLLVGMEIKSGENLHWSIRRTL